MRKYLVVLVLVICLGVEYYSAWSFMRGIVPFPENECYLHTLNGFLRDTLILGALLLLYSRRKRIQDRVARYFPIVVLGVEYIAIGIYMVNRLELDWGFMTTLSFFTGCFNNFALVLCCAMCYHHWPNKGMKLVYFLSYFATATIMLLDGVYFWNTSTHIESVLFKNLNIYAAQGILGTTSPIVLAGVFIALIVLALLFRVNKPHKAKPNFTWSLLCLVAFGMAFNMTYLSLSAGIFHLTDQIAGLDMEVDFERGRRPARNIIAMPINVNFLHKAFFDTDKIVKDPWKFTEKELSPEILATLQELGIQADAKRSTVAGVRQYDRVVMLVMESVHRDYLHFYNKNIPQETTPYLDGLLQKYPHMDNYYSSDIPTTQGLNATFRSQIIYDEDLEGQNQASIFRSAQELGYKGVFMNASSRYYANEYREYPQQFGMQEYYAKEDLTNWGYSGASGWGFHNDTMYTVALDYLEKHQQEKMFLVVKTLDMHQPYPYYGIGYADMPESVRDSKIVSICGMYWVDHTIRGFFEQAAARNLLDDRTLVIITSDHNPHSGGEYKTMVQNEANTQSIAPIPLIFVSKNLAPLDQLRTAEYASQEDLAPTLVRLMGGVIPAEFMGRDLLQRTETPYALGYFGGKVYYHNSTLNLVALMDEESANQTKEAAAISEYLSYKYIQRHIKHQ